MAISLNRSNMSLALFIFLIIMPASQQDYGSEEVGTSDPYEQYAERLQQQLESLRKEHDVREFSPDPFGSRGYDFFITRIFLGWETRSRMVL